MTCAEFERALTERERCLGASSAEMREHLESCAPCGTVFALLSEDPAPSSPLPRELIDRITSQMLADLRPVRPVAPMRTFTQTFCSIFIGVALAGVAVFRPLGILLMGRGQAAAILIALALSTVVAVGVLSRQIVPATLQRLAAAKSIAVVPLALASLFFALLPMQPGADFWKRVAICTLIGAGMSLPAGGAAFVLLRRGAVVNPRVAGSAAGLFGGLVGLAVLELHCPILDPLHMVCAHVGALVLITLTGLLASALTQRGLLREH